MNTLRKNWAVLLMFAAIAGSGYISYTEAKDTAASIATKAEKKAVKKATAKAAASIRAATVEGCQRDNARAAEANENVRRLRILDVKAEFLPIVDCRVEYKAPKLP